MSKTYRKRHESGSKNRRLRLYFHYNCLKDFKDSWYIEHIGETRSGCTIEDNAQKVNKAAKGYYHSDSFTVDNREIRQFFANLGDRQIRRQSKMYLQNYLKGAVGEEFDEIINKKPCIKWSIT